MNISLPVQMIPLSGKAGAVAAVALIALAIYMAAKYIPPQPSKSQQR